MSLETFAIRYGGYYVTVPELLTLPGTPGHSAGLVNRREGSLGGRKSSHAKRALLRQASSSSTRRHILGKEGEHTVVSRVIAVPLLEQCDADYERFWTS